MRPEERLVHKFRLQVNARDVMLSSDTYCTAKPRTSLGRFGRLRRVLIFAGKRKDCRKRVGMFRDRVGCSTVCPQCGSNQFGYTGEHSPAEV